MKSILFLNGIYRSHYTENLLEIAKSYAKTLQNEGRKVQLKMATPENIKIAIEQVEKTLSGMKIHNSGDVIRREQTQFELKTLKSWLTSA